MAVTIEAIYRHGVLELLEPLDLKEEQRVSVTVDEPAASAEPLEAGETYDPRHLADLLREIAEAAPRRGVKETGSIDHDHYLYGAPKQSEKSAI